jgi:hypothetical protein
MLTPEQKEDAKLLILEAIENQGGMSPRVLAMITLFAVQSRYPQVTHLEMATLAAELLDDGLIDDGGYCDRAAKHLSN